jgi:hypothetical protein
MPEPGSAHADPRASRAAIASRLFGDDPSRKMTRGLRGAKVSELPVRFPTMFQTDHQF